MKLFLAGKLRAEYRNLHRGWELFFFLIAAEESVEKTGYYLHNASK